MSFDLDPEVAKPLLEWLETSSASAADIPQRGDALALREHADGGTKTCMRLLPPAPDVQTERFATQSADGSDIGLRWLTHKQHTSGSAVVYVHGGGMISGRLDDYEHLIRHYVQLTGVPFLAVDYRLAPEHTGNTPVLDAFAALLWLREHAHELQVDAGRIALMGDSSGGGVAAGAAILARDSDLTIAKQILIYPMLDDRNLTPDPKLEPFATWTYDNNYTGWHALLGDTLGTAHVPPTVAPARLKNFAGLAPVFIEVGELDIFRDESIGYAQGLYKAGVSCELHVHRGCYHGFDLVNLDADVTRRAMLDRVRAVRSF